MIANKNVDIIYQQTDPMEWLKRMTEQGIRKYLQQYRYLDQDINRKMLERESWEGRINNMASVCQTEKTDKGESQIIKQIQTLDKQIQDDTKKLIQLRNEIREKVNSIQDDTLRLLIEYHYINGNTLEQIAYKMNYSYVHICRLHKQALHQFCYNNFNGQNL